MSQAKIRLTNVSPIEEKQEDLEGDSRPDDIFPIRMASVVRVSKLPVIEQTSNIAVNVYKKVKKSNCVFNWSLKKAESTVSKAVKSTEPVVLRLRTPITKVDGLLCVGLDYIEAKVPGIKLPAHEMYANAKQFVTDCAQPCVNCAGAVKGLGVRTLVALRRCVCGRGQYGDYDGQDDEVLILHSVPGETADVSTTEVPASTIRT
ncbi:lipid storage droplets surface-binding protein 2-like isoform X2 [Zootermopsis nevadensis]|nr:lipid storage droplets surface-binding protein 2-like isoform X2 [Zootermopsis nevadensis]